MKNLKKPKWRIKLYRNYKFTLKLNWYIYKHLLWKDKFASPRVEYIPSFYFSWLFWEMSIVQGNDCDWEWYLWVTEYCDNNIEKAIKTYPWGEGVNNKFIRSNPNLTYNK